LGNRAGRRMAFASPAKPMIYAIPGVGPSKAGGGGGEGGIGLCTIKFAVSALARAAVLGSEYLNTIMFMH
jgi:hypothetical protein